MRQFLQVRGDYNDDSEQFFVFSDGTPVQPGQPRSLLHTLIKEIGLDHTLYGMHSFRIGRTTDLVKMKYTIEEIKLMGRWKSNVVFNYT